VAGEVAEACWRGPLPGPVSGRTSWASCAGRAWSARGWPTGDRRGGGGGEHGHQLDQGLTPGCSGESCHSLWPSPRLPCSRRRVSFTGKQDLELIRHAVRWHQIRKNAPPVEVSSLAASALGLKPLPRSQEALRSFGFIVPLALAALAIAGAITALAA
jgi:hypothetical protein